MTAYRDQHAAESARAIGRALYAAARIRIDTRRPLVHGEYDPTRRMYWDGISGVWRTTNLIDSR